MQSYGNVCVHFIINIILEIKVPTYIVRCCTSKSKKYNVLIVFILFCKTLLLLLRWDTCKVRDMFGGMGRFKGGLWCKAGILKSGSRDPLSCRV